MQLNVEESTPANIIPIDFTLELHLAIVMNYDLIYDISWINEFGVIILNFGLVNFGLVDFGLVIFDLVTDRQTESNP